MRVQQPAPLQQGQAIQRAEGAASLSEQGLTDERPAAIAQRRLAQLAAASPQAVQHQARADMIASGPRVLQQRAAQAGLQHGGGAPAAQLQAVASSAPAPVAQREEAAAAPNRTGLPDGLKSGIENLSGHSLDDVKVHYNSPKPQQLQAHAFAQGTDIHVAPGQEQHLPHEAWHVVQQKQGRVQATKQMKRTQINDDAGLEHEADVMGAKALSYAAPAAVAAPAAAVQARPIQYKMAGRTAPVVQRQMFADVSKSSGAEQMAVGLDELGYGDTGMKEFARLLKEDSSAIVKPKDAVTPSKRVSSVKAVLEGIELTGADMKDDFVAMLVKGTDWLKADEDTLKSIKDGFQEELDSGGYKDLYDMSKDDDWAAVSEDPATYDLNLSTIIAGVVGDYINSLSKASELTGLGYSEAWTEVLAYVAYDQCKDQFYAVESSAGEGPPKQPYISLINDIDSGVVTKLKYARHYDSAAGLGAEFTVEEPNEKKVLYNNIAVVHTHYAAEDEGPNYGHTKPYANRFSGGYGYTVVDLAKITAIDDTQKTYDSF